MTRNQKYDIGSWFPAWRWKETSRERRKTSSFSLKWHEIFQSSNFFLRFQREKQREGGETETERERHAKASNKKCKTNRTTQKNKGKWTQVCGFFTHVPLVEGVWGQRSEDCLKKGVVKRDVALAVQFTCEWRVREVRLFPSEWRLPKWLHPRRQTNK